MAWFGRRKSTGGGSALSERELNRLTELAITAFQERGVGVVRADDTLRTVGPGPGFIYSLDNLATTCQALPARRWPDQVGRWVSTATSLKSWSAADVPPAELEPRLYPRIAAPGTMPRQAWQLPRPDLSGLVELLVVDGEDTMKVMTTPEVEQIGDLDRLRAVALDNLRDRPLPDMQHMQLEDCTIDVLKDDEDPYVAAHLIAFDNVLACVYPGEDVSNGVLLAVPNRSTMFLHVLRDEDAGAAVHVLPKLGSIGMEEPWPLSPHCYWWRNGRTEQIDISDDGATVISHALLAAFRAVDAIDE